MYGNKYDLLYNQVNIEVVVMWMDGLVEVFSILPSPS